MDSHNSSPNCTASDSDAKLRAAQVIEDESKRMIRQVDELLEHCRESFSIRAEEQSIRLTAEIESLMPVVGDIDRLEQVFGNLLDNVPKHSPLCPLGHLGNSRPGLRPKTSPLHIVDFCLDHIP
jgi:signal transduction histidine kinase